MKTRYIFLTTICLFVLFVQNSRAQGCVAIRGNGAVCTMEHPMQDTSANGWLVTVSYRHFKSFRHFKGAEEQKQRLVLGNEVINYQNTADIAVTHLFNNRWSVTAGLPLIYNIRSSLYEHGGKHRHSSYSQGIGDLRLVADYWLLSSEHHKGNIQVGLGLKLPTGDYNATSTFYNVGPGGNPEVRPVDQSIQLGDGGVGIIAEANAFLNLNGGFSGYSNLYYLSNPRGTNGTRTYRETLRALLINESIMSVADQYMARLGVNYMFNGKLSALTVSAGARLEGIPVYDLIGKSDGFRRPGYVLSAEPSVNYSFKRVNLFASVPIALKRDRLQSVTDKENSVITGSKVQGDAAFADYAINFGVSFKL